MAASIDAGSEIPSLSKLTLDQPSEATSASAPEPADVATEAPPPTAAEPEAKEKGGAPAWPHIKLFVGGLPASLRSDASLRQYFEQFGEIADAIVRKSHGKAEQRGYGFICVRDEAVAQQIMAQEHVIDGARIPAPMLAKASNQQQQPSPGRRGRNRHWNPAASDGAASTAPGSCLKVFVGGLSHDVTEATFRSFFEQFGTLTDSVIMYDYATRRPRGFGFITFQDRSSVDKLLTSKYYELNSCRVEVKEAVPRDQMRKEGAGVSPAPAHKDITPSVPQPYDAKGLELPIGAYGYESYPLEMVPHNNYSRMVYPPAPIKGAALYNAASKPAVPLGIPVQPGFVPMSMSMVPPYAPPDTKLPVMPVGPISQPYMAIPGAMQGAMPIPVGMFAGMPHAYEYAMYPPPMSPPLHDPMAPGPYPAAHLPMATPTTAMPGMAFNATASPSC